MMVVAEQIEVRMLAASRLRRMFGPDSKKELEKRKTNSRNPT
jgi:hypothetical protein